MSFLAQWKAAKEKFETSAQEKKPSDKFLGLIRKGSSIEVALKKLDSAKNRKEVVTSLGVFDKAADEYCSTLSKEIKNPKAVTKVDQKSFTTALEKLEKTLQKIRVEGDKLRESLDVTADKAPVDAKAIQLAEEHMTRQRKYVTLLNAGIQIAIKSAAEAKRLHASAVADLKKYVDPKLANSAKANQTSGAQAVKQGMAECRGQARDLKVTKFKKYELAGLANSAADLPDVKGAEEPVPDRVTKEAKRLVAEIASLKQDFEKEYKPLYDLQLKFVVLEKEFADVDDKALKEAQAHINLRIKMTGEVGKWFKAAAANTTEMQKLLAGAKQFQTQAKTAQTGNNQAELIRLSTEAGKALTAAKKIHDAVEKEQGQRTASGSELMVARLDNGTPYDKLPPRIGGPLKKQRIAEFKKLDTAQRTWSLEVGKIQSLYFEIGGIAEQIEVMSGKVTPAKDYLLRLKPFYQSLDQEKKVLGDRTLKTQSMIAKIIPDNLASARQGEPEKVLAALEKHYEVLNQYREKSSKAKSDAQGFIKRADLIPSTDNDVVKLAAAVKKVATEVINLADQYEVEAAKVEDAFQTAFDELNTLVG